MQKPPHAASAAPPRPGVCPCHMVMRATGALAVAGVAVIVVYLVKSALGIDMMPGPSPLHHLLYHLVPRW
ncbi:MAG: hypothetical protein SFW09_20510 [Hyphomicrobiaceae bacterium]|nr:hypothetical protein [Hyphomicrobiaceae bacterium]